MGYSPMIKVLYNETLMDQSAQPQPQVQLVIHDIDPHQLHRHHYVSGEGLEVLLVTPHAVSHKTRVG